MKLDREVIARLEIRPGEPAGLASRDPATSPALLRDGLGGRRREIADQDLEAFRASLATAQELLWANATHAVLLVLQALDAAGKDGTIKHVMSGVNPQGCEVTSFKQPAAEELAHDFLWRAAKALPERGRIGIFNRSYYEEVLVVRVHPELVAAEHLAGQEPGPHLWRQRYEDINAFERHLDRNGVRLVKCFLHVSREEQRKRLLERLEDPSKRWKFSEADLAERARWDDYQLAYEEALTATSTPWAPWHVVPADHKHVLRALVGGLLVDAVDRLGLATPTLPADRVARLEAARAQLAAEGD